MRSTSLASVAVLCSLGAGIAAQNAVVPATMDGVEGGGGTNVPFGSSLACRYQCLYDVEELSWSGPRVITGINLRPDFNNGQATPPKGFIEISVLVSTSPRSSTNASSTFGDNYGTDATWVIENRIMQLPAQPVATVAPRPANILLPFDVPWAYGLTPATTSQPSADSLLIEIWVHGQPSGAYRVDNLSGCVAPTAPFGIVDPACAVGTQVPMELTGDASMLAGSNYNWRVDYGAPSMPFFVALNLTDQGGLLGNPAWPLPYPLFDPLNPTLASAALLAANLPWPAPGCYLNVSPAVSLGGLCDATGHGQVSAGLPPGREFVGTTFFAQAVCLAPTANPLRLITSVGRSTTVCGPLGVTRIHAFYNNTGTPLPAPPATGTLLYGAGLVVEVY